MSTDFDISGCFFLFVCENGVFPVPYLTAYFFWWGLFHPKIIQKCSFGPTNFLTQIGWWKLFFFLPILKHGDPGRYLVLKNMSEAEYVADYILGNGNKEDADTSNLVLRSSHFSTSCRMVGHIQKSFYWFTVLFIYFDYHLETIQSNNYFQINKSVQLSTIKESNILKIKHFFWVAICYKRWFLYVCVPNNRTSKNGIDTIYFWHRNISGQVQEFMTKFSKAGRKT